MKKLMFILCLALFQFHFAVGSWIAKEGNQYYLYQYDHLERALFEFKISEKGGKLYQELSKQLRDVAEKKRKASMRKVTRSFALKAKDSFKSDSV